MKAMKRKLCAILCAALLAGALVPTASAASFSDISGHWAASYIETCAGRGIVDGVGGGYFDPEGKVTNAQFVKMLCSAFFAAEEQTFENENRAAIDDYFGGSVQWYACKSYYFQKLGLLNNVDYNIQSASSANQPMNRNNMAQVAANVLAQKGINASEDDKALAQATLSLVNDYYTIPESNRDAVKTCYALSIITGTDGGKFDGGSTMTRAQACTVITRLLDVVGKGSTDSNTPVTPTVKDIVVTTKPNTSGHGANGTAHNVTDNGFSTGYLNDGKEINEANVKELIEKAKTIWPESIIWTSSEAYNNSNNNWYQNPSSIVRNGLGRANLGTTRATSPYWGCGGLVSMLNDYIFGKTGNPIHRVTDFADAHPGDIVVQINADSSPHHVMMVTDIVKTGNRAGAVFCVTNTTQHTIEWPDTSSPWNAYQYDNLAGYGSVVILSRWPQ